MPWYAVFRLNFGVRNYRCKNCRALCSMNPYVFLRWTLIPWALILLSLFTLKPWGLWPFIAIFIGVRLIWVFASPRIVPMQSMMPPK